MIRWHRPLPAALSLCLACIGYACKTAQRREAAPVDLSASVSGAMQAESGMRDANPSAARDAIVDAAEVDDTKVPEVLYPLHGSNLGHIYVDDAHLWYVHSWFVFQAHKDGTGTPQQLGEARSGASTRFRDDHEHIYWLNDDRIVFMPKAGGPAQEWPLGRSFAYSGWVFVDDYIYLLDGIAFGIWRLPKGGGSLEEFVSGLNTSGDKGGGVVLSLIDRTLYASYLSDVWAISLDTRKVDKLETPAVFSASEVVTLAGDFYFIDGRHDIGGTLYRFRPGERGERGEPGEVPKAIHLEPESRNVVFLMADSARNKLYWLANTVGPVIEFDVAADKLTTRTTKETSNGIPVSDATYLYWARNSLHVPPGIMRLRK